MRDFEHDEEIRQGRNKAEVIRAKGFSKAINRVMALERRNRKRDSRLKDGNTVNHPHVSLLQASNLDKQHGNMAKTSIKGWKRTGVTIRRWQISLPGIIFRSGII